MKIKIVLMTIDIQMHMYPMQQVAGSVIFDLSVSNFFCKNNSSQTSVVGSMRYVSSLTHSFLSYFMSFTFHLLDIARPAACVLPAGHRRELSGPNCQNGQSNSVYASHKCRQYSQPATPTASIQHRH